MNPGKQTARTLLRPGSWLALSLLATALWTAGASRPARADGPTVQFAAASYTVGESDGFATITLAWSGSPGPNAEVRLSAGGAGDSATPNADYNIPINSSTGQLDDLRFFSQDTDFFVVVKQDRLLEPPETVTLTLQAVQGVTVGPQNTATLTIQDDGRLTAPTPVSFSWKAKNKDTAEVTLHWTNVAKNATGFEIYRSPGSRAVTESDLFRTVDGDRSSLVDTSVQPGHSYRYAVRAINETLDVKSAFSPEVTVSIGKPSGGGGGPTTQFGLRFSRTTLKFGSVKVHRTKALRLTIKNIRGTPARITVGGLDAPFAGPPGLTEFTLAGGQTRTLRVTFTPSQRGAFRDRLAIGLPDAQNSPQIFIPVSGAGVR